MGEETNLLPAWDLREHPMSYDCITDLSLHLDPENPLGNDWRMLTVHLGYDESIIISALERRKSPTRGVLQIYQTQSELPTWQGVQKAFRLMKRADVEDKLVVHAGNLGLSSESASDSLPVGWGILANPQRNLKVQPLNHTSLNEVSKLLNVEHPLSKDWKLLASKLKYNHCEIDQLGRGNNPAFKLLQDFQCKPGATLGELYNALVDLRRYDVIHLLWKLGELKEDDLLGDSPHTSSAQSLPPYTAYSDRPILRQTARQMSEQNPRTQTGKARSKYPTSDDIELVVQQLQQLGFGENKARKAVRKARKWSSQESGDLLDEALEQLSDSDSEEEYAESHQDCQIPPPQSMPSVMNITGGNIQIGNYNKIITTKPAKKTPKTRARGGGDGRQFEPRDIPPQESRESPQVNLKLNQTTVDRKRELLRGLGISEEDINILIRSYPEKDENELANHYFESQQQPVKQPHPDDFRYADQGEAHRQVRSRGEGREVQPSGHEAQYMPRDVVVDQSYQQGATGRAGPHFQEVTSVPAQSQNLPMDAQDASQRTTEEPVGASSREDVRSEPSGQPAPGRDVSRPMGENTGEQNDSETRQPTPTGKEQHVRFNVSEVSQPDGRNITGSSRTTPSAEALDVVPDSSLEPQTNQLDDLATSSEACGIQAHADKRRDDTMAAEQKSLKRHREIPEKDYPNTVDEEVKETPVDESFEKLSPPDSQSHIPLKPDCPTGTYHPPQETHEEDTPAVTGQTDFDTQDQNLSGMGNTHNARIAQLPGRKSEMDVAEDETDLRLRSHEPSVDDDPTFRCTVTYSEDASQDIRLPSLQESNCATEDTRKSNMQDPDEAGATAASTDLTDHQPNSEGKGEEEQRGTSQLNSNMDDQLHGNNENEEQRETLQQDDELDKQLHGDDNDDDDEEEEEEKEEEDNMDTDTTPSTTFERLETGVYVLHSADIEQITNKREKVISSEGAFGPVYEGQFLQEGPLKGSKVAVKIRDTSGKHGEREYKREKSVAAVKHPNILSVIGICEDEGYPMSIVYPFKENRDLAYQIKGKNPELTWQMRLKIGICLFRAVNYLLSSKGDRIVKIYHRDIKSANVLLDASWWAYLGDTGLTREVSVEKSHLSMTGTQMGFAGTRGYQDPVLFKKPPNYYDDNCDIYSLGKVLLELLTNVLAQDMKGEDYIHNIWDDDDGLSDPDKLCQLAIESSVGWPKPEENVVTKEFAEVVTECLKTPRKKRAKPQDMCKKLEALAKDNNIEMPDDTE